MNNMINVEKLTGILNSALSDGYRAVFLRLSDELFRTRKTLSRHAVDIDDIAIKISEGANEKELRVLAENLSSNGNFLLKLSEALKNVNADRYPKEEIDKMDEARDEVSLFDVVLGARYKLRDSYIVDNMLCAVENSMKAQMESHIKDELYRK